MTRRVRRVSCAKPVRLPFFTCLLVSSVALSVGSGCASGYRSALGYRARHAVLSNDVEAFPGLMAEAAGTTPRHAYDNPKRTVLSHFLDLGGSERFFPIIDAWRARGWVDDTMTCAIHRARWKGVFATNPEEADRVAGVCLDRARSSAVDPERSWEVSACLAEAPFLTQSSTAALAPFLDLAADPTEPLAFRAGILEGITHVYLQDPAYMVAQDGKLALDDARTRAVSAYDATERRFRAVVARVRSTTDTTLLAGGTAFGALELERVSLALGRSFFDAFLASGIADDEDIVWGWVRASKARPRQSRLDTLGLFDRRLEPAGDAYWFACLPVSTSSAAATMVLRRTPEPACPAGRRALGPYPLQATARGAAKAMVAVASEPKS